MLTLFYGYRCYLFSVFIIFNVISPNYFILYVRYFVLSENLKLWRKASGGILFLHICVWEQLCYCINLLHPKGKSVNFEIQYKSILKQNLKINQRFSRNVWWSGDIYDIKKCAQNIFFKTCGITNIKVIITTRGNFFIT